ncbi:MAG: FAD-dependent oxidoreductase [Acidobacteriota bacterium]
MISSRSHTVAVIGAGTAGMAAALFLLRAGHRITLFERVGALGRVGSGVLLQPAGLHVPEEPGLASQIRASGSQVERLLGKAVGGRTVVYLRYAAKRSPACTASGYVAARCRTRFGRPCWRQASHCAWARRST